MNLRIRSLALPALLALPLLATVAAAQDAAVSGREYLRADLREESLIEEAFRAAKRVPIGARFEIAARRSVATLLLELGRESDAKILIDQAAAAALKDKEGLFTLDSVAPLYGRVHTQKEMHDFLRLFPERGGRVQGSIAHVKDCVRRDDLEDLQSAVGLLTAASYVGWTPLADAWLAIGRRKLGQSDSFRSYENRVLEGPYSKVDELDSGRAIQALVHQALEREDVNEACRLIDTYAASPKVAKAANLFAIGHMQVKVVQALASQGDYKRARSRAETIEEGADRATAFAELGVAIWSKEGAIAAESDLKTAGAIAKVTGILARCRVAEALYRGGFEEAANAMARDGIVALIELEKGPSRELYASFLADTSLKLGHADSIAMFESELNEEDSIEFLISLAGLYAKQTNREGLFELLSVFEKLDAEKGTSFFYTRAVREALLKLKDRESGDRFAAELARAVVRYARSQPADMRAWLLASLLEYDACAPVELSSYHPWTAPPTLADHWTTPEDANVAAALLQGALGEKPMPQIRAIRMRRLRTDTETDLYEYDAFQGSLRYHYLLLRTGEDVLLLDGTKEILDPIAMKAKWQDSDEALFDLVHLLISTRSGQGGRFRIIENPGVLEELRKPQAELPKLRLRGTRLVERTEDGATLAADMLIHRRLERIQIRVHDGGQVSITEREIIAEELPVELEYYNGNSFERRLVALDEIWPLHKTDEAAWAYRLAELYALGLGEGGWRADPSLAFYFLNVAKKNGHPNPIQLIGRAWRDGKGVAADPAEAIEWFVAAASRGNLDACIDAAELLLASPSPERRDRARTVLNFGRDRGSAECAARLKELEASSTK